jgi:ABC-type phosphonate transport system ATPase subunit
MSPLLQAKNLHKSFAKQKAVNDVSLNMFAGK